MTQAIRFVDALGDALDSDLKAKLGYSACQASGNDPTTYSTSYSEKLKDKGLTMLSYYALPRVADECIALYDESESQASAIAKVQARVYGFLISSQDYYAPLIGSYESMADKLLKEVTTKYGTAEMPQSATMDSIQDSQENDLSRVRIQLNEAGTPMERLAELQENYRSLYRDWAEEFISKFIIYRASEEGEEE